MTELPERCVTVIVVCDDVDENPVVRSWRYAGVPVATLVPEAVAAELDPRLHQDKLADLIDKAQRVSGTVRHRGGLDHYIEGTDRKGEVGH